jgi:hypothetical protein
MNAHNSAAAHNRLIQWLNQFARRRPIVAALVLGFFCIVLFLKLFGGVVFTPRLNPNPQDPITIRGAFPFDKGYDLVFNQGARTTAPWASVVCGGFGLTRGWKGFACRGGYETFLPKKIDCCHYEITLYRDHYLPGIAGWENNGFGFNSAVQGKPLIGGGGVPRKSTEMDCADSAERLRKSNGALLCIPEIDESGPDVYNTSTRYTELNIRLRSELQSTAKEK